MRRGSLEDVTAVDVQSYGGRIADEPDDVRGVGLHT